MSEDNKKNEYITRTDLEEQTQVILGALDKRLNKMDINIDKRLTESESRLGKKIDDVRNLVDGYVKEQEDFKEEFVIVKEEGKQMKQAFKEKLGVEIRAI